MYGIASFFVVVPLARFSPALFTKEFDVLLFVLLFVLFVVVLFVLGLSVGVLSSPLLSSPLSDGDGAIEFVIPMFVVTSDIVSS